MDFQKYIRDNFTGKRIILVGNSPFAEDQSELIDGHDVVIRFNFFSRNGFEAGRCGRKLDYWFVNLDVGRMPNARAREHREALVQHCSKAKALPAAPQLFAASPDDKHKRLKDAVAFYASDGIELRHPDAPLSCPTPKEPSVGFYTACRILREQVPITVIGCTDKVSKYHDGASEIAFLQHEQLVTFRPMSNI